MIPSLRLKFWLTGLLTLCLTTSLSAADATAPLGPMPYPLLPEAISSFGAAVLDGYVYVFGGHAGRLPGSSLDGLSPHFCRINIAQPDAKWEELPMHKTSQSPGLLAFNGQLYRVGGLSFKNKAGDETQFNSLDVFAKFDPQTKTWTELAPLPLPRSSLDAAIVGNKVYVVGGWNLQEGGSQDAFWHDTVVAFDLTNEAAGWTAVAAPPFKTRALAAAGLNGKLYVMGGMTSDNEITQNVHVYDTATDTWSTGPVLSGSDSLSGFAISAYVADNKLYYSGSEGIVYRLSENGTQWEVVERLVFPRSFHRLVADKERVIIIGGVARGGGYLANLEIIGTAPKAENPPPKIVEFSVKFDGQAKQDQALLLMGSALYAFGGNNSRAPHDFTKEQFNNEAFKFDLAGQSVEKLDNLPQPVQGGVAYLAGDQIDQSIYILGGIASPGEKFASLDTILQYRLRSKAWMEEVGHLPTTRAMFSAATSQGAVWVFGGARVNTADKGLVADTWMWNPSSGEPASVVPDAAIPTTRRSFGGAKLGNTYYVVGGLGSSQIADSAAAFDFETKKWTDIAAPKIARVFPNLAAAGGKLYLFGGFASVDGHFQPATAVEAYDVKANTWQTVWEELPFAHKVQRMMEFQDRLLFYGIDRSEDGVANFVVFDPQPTTAGYGQVASGAGRFGGGDGPGVPRDMLTRLLRMDKNKDGKVSLDEVGERFRPIIERADADKDGAATQDELQAILARDRAGDRPRGM